MMELIGQKFVKINIIILMLMFFYSCQEIIHDKKLECILDSIKVNLDEKEIEVGQHNGWTDTTNLILITYHRKSMNGSVVSKLKGLYKGRDIYFYQSVVDSLDNGKYAQIPNSIDWNNFTPKEIDENIIHPPYDPINIQIEYNMNSNCIVAVIKGKGYINPENISKCKCDY